MSKPSPAAPTATKKRQVETIEDPSSKRLKRDVADGKENQEVAEHEELHLHGHEDNECDSDLQYQDMDDEEVENEDLGDDAIRNQESEALNEPEDDGEPKPEPESEPEPTRKSRRKDKGACFRVGVLPPLPTGSETIDIGGADLLSTISLAQQEQALAEFERRLSHTIATKQDRK